MRIASILQVAGLAGFAAAVVGCGATPSVPTVTTKPAAISGRVFGGQQPITEATIQLYTVGTGADGVGSMPLLTPPVKTDGNGNFTITGLYSCTGATEVYLTATGGYVSGVQNPNVTLMAALGACSSLSASTNINMNELTTVAAVNALYPYMSVTAGSAPVVGSGTSDVAALDAAFTLASEFVNTATGVAPGNVPSGYMAPVAEINTLGDAMANCVNSGGGTANDGTACGNFFKMTTPMNATAPTDTVGALLYLAKNPALNTGWLFASASPTSPFQPQLVVQPVDFSVVLTPVGTLQISPSSIGFGSVTEGTFPAAVPVTITNTGAAAALIAPVTITGTGAGQYYLSSTCGNTLAAGASCTVQVSAYVTAAGPQSASLVVTSVTAGSPQSVGLSVTGVAPGAASALAVGASSLTWYTANTNQDITLTNTGAVPIVFSASTGTNYFGTNVTGDCNGVIPAQAVCTLTVVSTGIGTTGSNDTINTYADTLTIVSNASGSPQNVALSSQNRQAALVSTAGGIGQPIVFPATKVGSSSSKTFTVFGASYYSGVFATVNIGGLDPQDFSAPDCPSQPPGAWGNCGNSQSGQGCSVVVGYSCSGPIVFTPTLGGTRTAKIYLYYQSEYVTVTGTAPSGASFTASNPAFGYSYLYGSTPATATGTVTVTNTGSTTLNPTTFAIAGANASNFTVTGNTCASLASLATCTITVAFSANTVASYTATLTITDTATGTFQNVALSTTVGSYPPIMIAPSSFTFGNQVVGTTSAAQSFAVSDVYGNPLNHPVTVAANYSDFILPSGSSCSASAVQTCMLSIAFNPSAAYSTSGALLTATDTVSGFTTTASLSGTGYVIPVVTATPSSYTFPTQPVNSTSAAKTFVLNSTAVTTYSSVTMTGAVNGNFTMTNYCTGLISSCSIIVNFVPTARGTQSATITAVSTASNSPTVLTVTGTAY
jgi:hypothetical protein